MAPTTVSPFTTTPCLEREFTEQYVYDANSNLTSLKHLWDATTKYHRQFGVETNNNRLNDLTIGATTFTYQYDAAGNLTQENTERKMTWDYADRMRVFRNQVSGSEASVYAQYLFSSAKVIILPPPECDVRVTDFDMSVLRA